MPRPRRQFVIGQAIAAATEAERRRLHEPDLAQSPMPSGRYDSWQQGDGLLSPSRTHLDSAISAICRDFANKDPEDRAQIRHSISMDEIYTLLTFSKRASVFALRDPDAPHLSDGLHAIAMIERDRVDIRDVLMALAIAYHAAVRTGRSVDDLFLDSAALAEPSIADRIVRFLSRKDRNDLQGWGFQEVEIESGIGLVERQNDRYRSTFDLLRIAIEIGHVVEADRYGAVNVTIGTSLPAVWLRGAEQGAVKRALKSVSAGAIVRAQLRPDVHPTHASQSFLVFIQEFRNAKSAVSFLELSRAAQDLGTPTASVQQGRLFCLVVGRSWMAEVSAYETTEGLQRFVVPIAEVLARHAREIA